MNPFSILWRNEAVIFHVRAGGCGGCGDMVDEWIRSQGKYRLRTTESVSPRQADIIVITGPLYGPALESALSVIEQAPIGCKVLVLGDCASGCGPGFKNGEAENDADLDMSFDYKIEGCPVDRQSLAKVVKRCLGLS
ncbi:MAG: hypothetical protein JW738_10455 [Actinobacteria bacterium]|nr:hypothetical protein [Actinomycetota bacterium]